MNSFIENCLFFAAENSKIEQNVVKNKYFGQLQEIEDFKNAGE